MAESTALAEDRTMITEHHDGADAAGKPAAAAPPVSAEPLVAAELLVEEVSIDGMCGVY
jgi:mycofactocin precursor